MDGDTPEKPENPNRDVGVDVGILNHPHDTDKTAVESPDSSDEHERLDRAHRWWGTKIEYVVAKYDIGLERISIDFDLASADGTGPIIDTALVKSGTLAPSKKCAIVELGIKIGDRWHWTTANFEGRSQMQYLVILGRDIWGLSR